MIAALRRWAKRYTERSRYSPVGIAFHWIMAALVIFQLGWGVYMGLLSPGGSKLASYEIHSGTGLAILALAIGRAIWRLMIPGPINDADRLGWQSRFAHITHGIFYVCFFGLPLSGWVMWSATVEQDPLYLAGFMPWPQLPFDTLPLVLRWQIMDIAEDVHLVLVVALTVLVPLHVAAALKHHFWDRHDVLRGMLPEIPDEEDPEAGQQHKPRRPRRLVERGAG